MFARSDRQVRPCQPWHNEIGAFTAICVIAAVERALLPAGMRLVSCLALLSTLGVFAACGGAEAPAGDPDSRAPAGTSSGASAVATAEKSASYDADKCPPSAAPSNPPECPAVYTYSKCVGPQAFDCPREMECWYPSSGDQVGRACPAAALIACVPRSPVDAGVDAASALDMPEYVARCSQ